MKTITKSVFIFLFICFSFSAWAKPTVTVASKTFTESMILGEIMAQVIEGVGEANVDRKLNLGDTAIVYQGVKTRNVDFYVEYTGTIAEAFLKNPKLTKVSEIRKALKDSGIVISEPLGFNNTYAISVKKALAEKLQLKTIQDLKKHPELRAGFTVGFYRREDGYPSLQQVYGLNFNNVRALSHGLKIQALVQDEIDLADLYTTDAQLSKFNLAVLKDNRRAFPDYFAVILSRQDIVQKFPKTWQALRNLERKISEEKMIELNSMVELEKLPIPEVAAKFLNKKHAPVQNDGLWVRTLEHINLVFIPLLGSILLGIPLAIIARTHAKMAQIVLLITGLIQTIPSIALLCFLIPIAGIGNTPAKIAMFLYGLLPIVRSTYVGLTEINPKLLEVARSLGLKPWQRLKLIQLPLAARNIMSGIKTAAIINVGTATIGAFIGAGGYGVLITNGLNSYDMDLVLQGAIPAAGLALVAHGVFELVDRVIIPKGLR